MQEKENLLTRSEDNSTATQEVLAIMGSNGSLELKHLDIDKSIDVIGEAMERIMADLGIQKLPDKESSQKIIRFIRFNYSDLSPRELVLAFELALLGKYPVNLDHFNELTLKFITPVLNAYKAYKREMIIIKTKENVEEKQERKMTTEARNSLFTRIIQNVNELYKNWMNGKDLYDNYYSEITYKLFEEFGIIKITNEAKKEILENEAKVILATRVKKKAELTPLSSAFKEALNDSDELKTVARVFMLLRYFEKCHKEGLKDFTETLETYRLTYVRKK